MRTICLSKRSKNNIRHDQAHPNSLNKPCPWMLVRTLWACKTKVRELSLPFIALPQSTTTLNSLMATCNSNSPHVVPTWARLLSGPNLTSNQLKLVRISNPSLTKDRQTSWTSKHNCNRNRSILTFWLKLLVRRPNARGQALRQSWLYFQFRKMCWNLPQSQRRVTSLLGSEWDPQYS